MLVTIKHLFALSRTCLSLLDILSVYPFYLVIHSIHIVTRLMHQTVYYPQRINPGPDWLAAATDYSP